MIRSHQLNLSKKRCYFIKVKRDRKRKKKITIAIILLHFNKKVGNKNLLERVEL